MTRSLVTGATGFVGRHLIDRLKDEGPVRVLSRDAEKARKAFAKRNVVVEAFAWDPAEGRDPPPEAFDGVDVVFSLAGESIGEGSWTDAKKRRILDSRVEGTRKLVHAILRASARPQTLVSASAIGYYGDRGSQVLTEDAPPGEGFLADVCVAWEREAGIAEQAGLKVVMPRLGVVLGKDGGVLEKILPLFRWGVGGKLGSGEQYVSWIHIDDLVELLLFAASREDLRGPVNAVAPHAVTNAELTKALGDALHRPTLFGAPKFALKALAGEMSEMILQSQRVVPRMALDAGFTFRYPTIEGALGDLLRS